MARRGPGDNVLPDQFQTVTAILASDWCQKNASFSFLRALFFHPFRLSLAPTICPWVSKDENDALLQIVMVNSGTHLMKNCDSQCRTNESQLKKTEWVLNWKFEKILGSLSSHQIVKQNSKAKLLLKVYWS